MAKRFTIRGGLSRFARRSTTRVGRGAGAGTAHGAEADPTPSPAIEHLLSGVAVSNGVAELSGRAHTDSTLEPLHAVRAWMRLHGTGRTIELPVRPRDTRSTTGGTSLAFTVVVDPALIPAPGNWELEIATVRDREDRDNCQAVAFGGTRLGRADTDGRVLASGEAILTFTAAGGGAVVTLDGREAPRATAERIQADQDGRPEIALKASCVDEHVRVYADVTPAGSRDARQRLPWRRLSKDTIAVRLPVPHREDSTLQSRLEAVVDGVRVPVHLGHVGELSIDGRLTVRREDEEILTVTRHGDIRHEAPRGAAS